MNLQQLKCFVAAVEAGNFTQASKQLHTAQSALSRQISNLEAELGVRLFVRKARGVELSAEGFVAYDRAQQLINDFRSFSRDVTSANPPAVRKVSLTAHGGIGPRFLPEIARLMRRPGGALQFRMAEGLSEHIEREVFLGEYDIGVVIRRRGVKIERPDLETIRLAEDAIFAVEPAEYDTLVGEPWSAANVFQRALILPPSKSLERVFLENWARQHDLALNVAGEASSISMRIELARSIGGVCFLPGIALAQLPDSSRWQIHQTEQDEYNQGIEWFVIFRRTGGDGVIGDVVDVVRKKASELFARSARSFKHKCRYARKLSVGSAGMRRSSG
jgi:DNA-binding transcriptional LysR family regulator